jgi:hypothetical protein
MRLHDSDQSTLFRMHRRNGVACLTKIRKRLQGSSRQLRILAPRKEGCVFLFPALRSFPVQLRAAAMAYKNRMQATKMEDLARVAVLSLPSRARNLVAKEAASSRSGVWLQLSWLHRYKLCRSIHPDTAAGDHAVHDALVALPARFQGLENLLSEDLEVSDSTGLHPRKEKNRLKRLGKLVGAVACMNAKGAARALIGNRPSSSIRFGVDDISEEDAQRHLLSLPVRVRELAAQVISRS